MSTVMARAIRKPTSACPKSSGQRGTRSCVFDAVSATTIAATIGPISSDAGRPSISRPRTRMTERASRIAHRGILAFEGRKLARALNGINDIFFADRQAPPERSKDDYRRDFWTGGDAGGAGQLRNVALHCRQGLAAVHPIRSLMNAFLADIVVSFRLGELRDHPGRAGLVVVKDRLTRRHRGCRGLGRHRLDLGACRRC
ncbi:conserved hypothetical protein [Ricinus communis]|uniref:Uncharacterized protein n=1 Tax=Ricinus communis TaxID=3988 RepID=B9TFC2_RICCO|nr:conserved hypothetical protein [Ricinus communis]